jgi:hypothetical protein
MIRNPFIHSSSRGQKRTIERNAANEDQGSNSGGLKPWSHCAYARRTLACLARVIEIKCVKSRAISKSRSRAALKQIFGVHVPGNLTLGIEMAGACCSQWLSRLLVKAASSLNRVQFPVIKGVAAFYFSAAFLCLPVHQEPQQPIDRAAAHAAAARAPGRQM